MSSGKLRLAGIVAVIAVIAVMMTAFTVDQRELAIKKRLGKIVKSHYQPGLHFRIPFVEEIIRFDRRLQTLDAPAKEYQTEEKKFVVVDSFVKWRIKDAERFYLSTTGDMLNATRLLSARVNTASRDEFAKHPIQDAIADQRKTIMAVIATNVGARASELGIEIIDLRVKKIDFPKVLSEAVFRRMRTEREQRAKELRAEGKEQSARIHAAADRTRTEILASAYREAEKVRGEGDAQSAETYAQAFNQDGEFYAFWRSLKSYTKAFDKGGDIMMLKPESEFLRYLNQPK
ncbi:MAG: protease modulator HflC [Pseudomonadota bacterium]